MEGANSPTDSDNQALEPELSDDEGTEVDSQFDSPTGSPLLVADAACPTCETLDDALEIAKTREMESYLRIEELEQQIALLQREHEEDNSTVSEADKEDESTTESQCVLDVEDDEADETEALSGNGGISSVVHASSVSLASAALLALVVESLKKRSPTEALAIVVIALTCMGIMLASFAWNIATATL
ncbi:kinesin-like protein [Phytophthora cinnamomi]|uniref:kinesin-like protein n=1 Tax=Phytophthora cinnamomi TaxID=4785 RepID=UPI00355962C2|nr:kinesin-like protein [Phytophthora cinnamomi]